MSLGPEHVVRTNIDVGILLLPVSDQRFGCDFQVGDGNFIGFDLGAYGLGRLVCNGGGSDSRIVFIFPQAFKVDLGRLVRDTVQGHLSLVYVPFQGSKFVYFILPSTRSVVDLLLDPFEVAVDRLLIDDADFLSVSYETCAQISIKSPTDVGQRLPKKLSDLALLRSDFSKEFGLVGFGFTKVDVL